MSSLWARHRPLERSQSPDGWLARHWPTGSIRYSSVVRVRRHRLLISPQTLLCFSAVYCSTKLFKDSQEQWHSREPAPLFVKIPLDSCIRTAQDPNHIHLAGGQSYGRPIRRHLACRTAVAPWLSLPRQPFFSLMTTTRTARTMRSGFAWESLIVRSSKPRMASQD